MSLGWSKQVEAGQSLDGSRMSWEDESRCRCCYESCISSTYQGVTGFDFGCRGRGSGPRMNGYLDNDPFKETTADNEQPAYALAA